MAESQPRKGGEGLSLQTLVVAAVASAVAAVVVSHVWKGGTVLAAAMTPVVVSIVKEALQRPMQSEVVRRSATSARQIVAGTAAARTETARRRSPAVGTVPTPPQNGTNGEVTQGDVLLSHPRRTYGPGARRRTLRGRPLKLAIVTGLLAFVVALVVITVPELVFGGAVSSSHRTTFFGGHSSSQKKSDQQKTTTQEQQQSQPTQTTPQSTTPQATPTQPTPTTTQPQAQPQQPAPNGGAAPAPAPSPPSTPTP